ncbi:hypothetical protein BC941DRAFT_506846 [Chlamydoabsidia padenii]|nr:hypothetical protein BC941DRAFT_506846 [Chlamydoabsidia padenii]
MPVEKFKVAKTDPHAAKNFFGTFSVSTDGLHSTTVLSYPIVGGIDSIHDDPESHLDRRSAHNALERQRREILNAKFQELAHALPSLQSVRRPSKTMIVAKSLDYVSKSFLREKNYINQIKKLGKQNERLRKQAKVSKALMAKHKQSSGMKKKPVKSSSIASSSQQQQMSPPLSPEANSQHYAVSSSMMGSTWPVNDCSSLTARDNDLMMMMLIQQQQQQQQQQPYLYQPSINYQQPDKLAPFFGSYQWQDGSSLYIA